MNPNGILIISTPFRGESNEPLIPLDGGNSLSRKSDKHWKSAPQTWQNKYFLGCRKPKTLFGPRHRPPGHGRGPEPGPGPGPGLGPGQGRERMVHALGWRRRTPGRMVCAPGRRGRVSGRKVRASGRSVRPPGRRVRAPGRRGRAAARRVLAPGWRGRVPGRRVHAPGRRWRAENVNLRMISQSSHIRCRYRHATRGRR